MNAVVEQQRPPWVEQVSTRGRELLEEVWLVDAKDGVRVHGRGGPLAASSFGIDISTVALDPPWA